MPVLSEGAPIRPLTYFMATWVVPAGSWLLFASTTAEVSASIALAGVTVTTFHDSSPSLVGCEF